MAFFSWLLAASVRLSALERAPSLPSAVLLESAAFACYDEGRTADSSPSSLFSLATVYKPMSSFGSILCAIGFKCVKSVVMPV